MLLFQLRVIEFMKKIGQWFRNFMAGRYGPDKLNTYLLWCAVIVMVINLFVNSLLLTVLYYALIFLTIFRMLSRQTYRRYEENRKFLAVLNRIKDRKHRYFNCPKCRQLVRVPRGKGKISITCPKCREKFIKKT